MECLDLLISLNNAEKRERKSIHQMLLNMINTYYLFGFKNERKKKYIKKLNIKINFIIVSIYYFSILSCSVLKAMFCNYVGDMTFRTDQAFKYVKYEIFKLK